MRVSSYHLLSGQKAVGQELAGSDGSSGISLVVEFVERQTSVLMHHNDSMRIHPTFVLLPE